MPETLEAIVARLRRQISRGEPILFLGAGFSLGASNHNHNRLPTTQQLAEAFWHLTFPDDEFDPRTPIGDSYYAAKARHPKPLLDLVRSTLSVDPATLPASYRDWFAMPWSRCYTLNIDDLELAAASAFNLDRGVRSISAASAAVQGDTDAGALEVVHLNGAIWDDLDHLTFSELDYAARSIKPDAWLAICSTHILARPVVFVGTELHESSLWQYVEYRRQRGGRGSRELRPGSYLVTPSLNQARRLLLQELNIDWVPMTAEQFAADVLTQLGREASAGLDVLRARSAGEARRRRPHLVTELTADSTAASAGYLLGQEPTWADIQEGLAVPRECDENVYQLATATLASHEPSVPLIITGTAGSGKSSCLMRLGLRLAAEGLPVYWIDERSNVDSHGLREIVTHTQDPLAILIDDADVFGRLATNWAKDLPQLRTGLVVVFAVRSTKIDGLLDSDTLGGIQPTQATMPHLTDADIDALIDVLDRNNRLGELKGMSNEQRIAAFKRQAGRQLLVAMIQATSGKQLREKVYEEFAELPEDKKFLYALLALVHSQRYSMDRDEILVATGKPDNEVLNALEQLVERNIVIRDTRHTNYTVRHRMIADELINAPEMRAYMHPLLAGICFAFATKVRPGMLWHDRPLRRLIRFMNHDYLIRMTDVEAGRDIYGQLEGLLNWDSQYWLQRGSLEVEEGDLELATNFLGQARSLSPGDRYVETEYAYLLMKKASLTPDHPEAGHWFEEGRTSMEDLINTHGKKDAYPYHVLGSQGLAWARRGKLPVMEKRALLARLLEQLDDGIEYHRRADALRALKRDVEREWLSTAVRSASD